MLWITVIQFFITTCFYWLSFQKLNGNHEAENNPVIISQIENNTKEAERNYLKSKQEYQQKVDSLTTRLFYTEILLNKEKVISNTHKAELNKLLMLEWDTLSPTIKISACDSLREEVQRYVAAQEIKDTLYEQKIVHLEMLHSETKQQLFICDTTRQLYKNQLDVALLHTKICNEQLKKQKRQNLILKIGAGIVAVLTVAFAVK